MDGDLSMSLIETDMRNIETIILERTGDIYVYDNWKQCGNKQWLSE